jgi:hypothetical protein
MPQLVGVPRRHADPKTTEIYAERDREQAARVMREIG